jgi:hypothetical protein
VYPHWISRIGAPLIAFVLTVAPSVSTVHAVEDARKVSKDAFVGARSLVKKREVRERFEPSNPLMAGGENVQPLLISRP